jgi:hypothetical protein
MNQQQFSSFIQNPDLLNKEDIPLLNNMVRDFPFCQTFQLLLAKTLHNEKSIQYNHQLKIAAAYATDRKILYKIIVREPKLKVAAAQLKENPVPINDESILDKLALTELIPIL